VIILVDLDVMEVRRKAAVNDVYVKYMLARSMMLTQTSRLWQQWLNQWFIVGTPKIA